MKKYWYYVEFIKRLHVTHTVHSETTTKG